MTGIGLITRGMVSIPLAVLQKCRAVQEDRVKPASIKTVVCAPATAKVSVKPEVEILTPVAPVVNKPVVKAVARRAGTVKVTVGDAAAAPPAPAAPVQASPKPTVKISKSCSTKPRITVKKDE